MKMITSFNLVSICCHAPIFTRRGTEYPVGGSHGISFKFPACETCNEYCDSVPACGNCGDVGCAGECE